MWFCFHRKETDELLDLWLSDLTLSGTNKGSLQHLVFTHYPPFSDAGGSRPQFEHTFEAGGLVARLASIGAMGLVVGQRKSAALERIGSVNVYHIGGIKDNDSVSWSKFTIDPSCIALCNANLAACDCMVYERVR